MKKMLANFGGEVLSRSEMKGVKGGGCNAKCSVGGGAYEWSRPNNTMTQSQAISAQQGCSSGGGTGYWCCASCPQQ